MVSERVGYLVKRLQSALRARMDATLAEEGVSAAQYAALSLLQEEGAISNAELARRAFVTPQTMIRILDDMTSNGWIERVPSATHGRVLENRLSPTGRRRAQRCHHKVLAIEEAMLAALSSSDRKVFARMLQSAIDALASHPRSERIE